MNAIVEIDKSGRLVIPKKMRDTLHLRAGDRLAIEQRDDGVFLRPAREEAKLVRKNGWWVMTGTQGMIAEDTRRMIEAGYEEREKRILTGSGLD